MSLIISLTDYFQYPEDTGRLHILDLTYDVEPNFPNRLISDLFRL